MTALLAGRVAIVTGAAQGLGRAHALALARHGAKLVINDIDRATAASVCEEIINDGGDAFESGANVQDWVAVDAMVSQVLERWGRVDILVSNAGILRDRTFANLELEDFRLVIDTHVMGSVNCARAVWRQMKARGFGRLIFTSSSSGLFGNFGQSAYSAAKMALVGLMKTLGLEGERYGIRVNCLAPSAVTRMTNQLFTAEERLALEARRVSPIVVALASDAAPNRRIVLAGAGSFEEAYVTMTRGLYLADEDLTPERLLERWDRICDRSQDFVPTTGPEQYQFEVSRARACQRERPIE